MSDADRNALQAGEPVVGQFAVSGGPDGPDAAPGVLSWAADTGATLELIDHAPGFPRTFDSGPLVVHGVLRGGEHLTLLDARLAQITNFRPTRVRAATLALGALTDPLERWPSAVYSTAALPEWRNDTGISYSRPAARKRPHDFRINFTRPTVDEVQVRGCQLAFSGQVDEARYWPDVSLRTRAVLTVNPTRPTAISTLLAAHSHPLLTLMSLAADRPDDLTHEVYRDTERRRITVWRQGRTIRESEWRGRYLFAADDISDYARTIRKWWSLNRRVWPAIGLFGDHVREGSTYSAGRFFMAYSALEVYGRAARKNTDLRKLRAYAQVDSQLIGCTNTALKLIDRTRGYLAHFNNATGAQRAEIEDQVMESTRRLSALMQACLLRELGFNKAKREQLLADHYRSWPLA